MGDAIKLRLITKVDLEPDKVIEAAVGQMDEVVIVGFDLEGNDYFAASKADAQSTLFHLERAKHRLMKLMDEMLE